MNSERILSIILGPHVSEKSARPAGEFNQYAFKVLPSSTKPEIKKAVENLFKVKVRSVRICNIKSRPARFGRVEGRHKSWKKAYVSLEKGQEISTEHAK